MKVIGWTAWRDPRYPDDDVSNALFAEQRAATISELRRRNIRFSGFYHQRGALGVPVFDNDTAFHVSFRSWGRIMSEAFPEPGDGEFAYVRWAWNPPCDPDCVFLPNPEDYPGFEPWDKPLTEGDIREMFGD